MFIVPLHLTASYTCVCLLVACTVKEALEAASLHPAQILGLEPKKGTLSYGADADMVLLDENLHVMATVIAGEIVYKSEQCRLSRIS